MKPFHIPLYEAIQKHSAGEPVGFHVPGHRYGQALRPNSQTELLYRQIADQLQPIMEIDVTELSSTDDLHHPEASIKEAQQLAARCFGADETYFLVGGSTSGNIALILALCEPGELVIVQRNVHKSVINGLKLAGASAVFVAPQFDEATGLATVPSIEAIEEALRHYPEAKAVFLSNPNYYGMSARLERYVELIHRYNKPVLVDEAHGAHYGLHPELPRSAIAAGADAVVQSTHKTLLALTMGAMLHTQGKRIPEAQLRESLAMIQSSSPSFPILISLDISRAMIDANGQHLFEQSLAAANALRAWLRKQSLMIRAVDWPQSSQEPRLQYDPLRVLLYDKTGLLTGFELQRELERRNCWAEMADPTYVVLVIGVRTSMEDIMKLQRAIELIHYQYNDSSPSVGKDPLPQKCKESEESWEASSNSIPGPVAIPVSFARDRFKGMKMERIGLDSSEGLVAAEMVIPYPPGIPILYPGEPITAEKILQIKRLAAAGAKFQSAAEAGMSSITIYR